MCVTYRQVKRWNDGLKVSSSVNDSVILSWILPVLASASGPAASLLTVLVAVLLPVRREQSQAMLLPFSAAHKHSEIQFHVCF